MDTATRSGDGALVAAITGTIKIYAMELACTAAATITVASFDGDETSTTLRVIHVPAGEQIRVGSYNEAGPPVCEGLVGEAITVTASTGTLQAWCAYTSG